MCGWRLFILCWCASNCGYRWLIIFSDVRIRLNFEVNYGSVCTSRWIVNTFYHWHGELVFRLSVFTSDLRKTVCVQRSISLCLLVVIAFLFFWNDSHTQCSRLNPSFTLFSALWQADRLRMSIVIMHSEQSQLQCLSKTWQIIVSLKLFGQ